MNVAIIVAVRSPDDILAPDESPDRTALESYQSHGMIFMGSGYDDFGNFGGQVVNFSEKKAEEIEVMRIRLKRKTKKFVDGIAKEVSRESKELVVDALKSKNIPLPKELK